MSKPILEEKDILNPNEAIELFVLSRRKFYKLRLNYSYSAEESFISC